MALKLEGANLVLIGGLLNGPRHIGALSSASQEMSGNNYSRVAIALANWQRDGATHRYENIAPVRFPSPLGASWATVNHWGLYSARTGGNTLLIDPIDAGARAPTIGADVGWAAGLLKAGFSGDAGVQVTADGSIAALIEGLLSGTRFITLHSGAPGTTGANRIDEPVQVLTTQWTLDTVTRPRARRARNNAVLSFGLAMTDLPVPLHIALRDGNQDSSKVLCSTAFSVTPRDPDIGDTLSLPVNALEIPVPIDAS